VGHGDTAILVNRFFKPPLLFLLHALKHVLFVHLTVLNLVITRTVVSFLCLKWTLAWIIVSYFKLYIAPLMVETTIVALPVWRPWE